MRLAEFLLVETMLSYTLEMTLLNFIPYHHQY